MGNLPAADIVPPFHELERFPLKCAPPPPHGTRHGALGIGDVAVKRGLAAWAGGPHGQLTSSLGQQNADRYSLLVKIPPRWTTACTMGV